MQPNRNEYTFVNSSICLVNGLPAPGCPPFAMFEGWAPLASRDSEYSGVVL